jgi:segregation and condensation protein A
MDPKQLEFESILEAYPVRLINFEGPLDLLLHLIKKNEMNVYDIPISTITQQYLVYLDLMQEMNLDVVGEFLVMAATLIHIKSRMLLPRPDPTQEDPEEDPRDALVRRLVEHQRFKAAAELLHEKEIQRSAMWTRADGPVADVVGRRPEPEIEVDLFSLMAAFRRCWSAPARGHACCCRPNRFRLKRESSNCWSGSRRRRPAGSRICLPTCRPAPA